VGHVLFPLVSAIGLPLFLFLDGGHRSVKSNFPTQNLIVDPVQQLVEMHYENCLQRSGHNSSAIVFLESNATQGRFMEDFFLSHSLGKALALDDRANHVTAQKSITRHLASPSALALSLTVITIGSLFSGNNWRRTSLITRFLSRLGNCGGERVSVDARSPQHRPPLGCVVINSSGVARSIFSKFKGLECCPI
jgi:hypothetical protein